MTSGCRWRRIRRFVAVRLGSRNCCGGAKRGALGWSEAMMTSGGDWLADQTCHAHQVVGGGHQVARQLGPRQAAVARLSEAAHFFQPAEGLLDAFPDLLTDGVTRMTSCAPIDGAASSAGVLRDVRRHLELAHGRDTLSRV